ncbi:MAG: hypothetical protein HRT74_13000 [Flavobacteriales bacterium]|nr:hypothetical protein [Flavobacteriales bacterium]
MKHILLSLFAALFAMTSVAQISLIDPEPLIIGDVNDPNDNVLKVDWDIENTGSSTLTLMGR